MMAGKVFAIVKATAALCVALAMIWSAFAVEFAGEGEAAAGVTEADKLEAGWVKPDSIFYVFDRNWERLKFKLKMFWNGDKAVGYGLERADERLAELKIMIAEKQDAKHVLKAVEGFREMVDKANAFEESVEFEEAINEDPKKGLEFASRLDLKLEEQLAKFDGIMKPKSEEFKAHIETVRTKVLFAGEVNEAKKQRIEGEIIPKKEKMGLAAW